MHLFHKYKVIKLDKYLDTSWGLNMRFTIRIYKCEKCGQIRTDEHYGRKKYQPLPGWDWELTDFK